MASLKPAADLPIPDHADDPGTNATGHPDHYARRPPVRARPHRRMGLGIAPPANVSPTNASENAIAIRSSALRDIHRHTISTAEILVAPEGKSNCRFPPNEARYRSLTVDNRSPIELFRILARASTHLAYSALVTTGDCCEPFERNPTTVAGQRSEFASGHWFSDARPAATSFIVGSRPTTGATEHQTGSSLHRPTSTLPVSW